jgi:hypothetical protein
LPPPLEQAARAIMSRSTALRATCLRSISILLFQNDLLLIVMIHIDTLNDRWLNAGLDVAKKANGAVLPNSDHDAVL